MTTHSRTRIHELLDEMREVMASLANTEDVSQMRAGLDALETIVVQEERDKDYSYGLTLIERLTTWLAQHGPASPVQRYDWRMAFIFHLFPFDQPLPVRALILGAGLGVAPENVLTEFLALYYPSAKIRTAPLFPIGISAVLETLKSHGVSSTGVFNPDTIQRLVDSKLLIANK